MNYKKSGYIVKTKDGKLGRTFHGKAWVNGKVPVYLATIVKDFQSKPEDPITKIPLAYSDTGTLFDPKTLTQIGMID